MPVEQGRYPDALQDSDDVPIGMGMVYRIGDPLYYTVYIGIFIFAAINHVIKIIYHFLCNLCVHIFVFFSKLTYSITGSVVAFPKT